MDNAIKQEYDKIKEDLSEEFFIDLIKSLVESDDFDSELDAAKYIVNSTIEDNMLDSPQEYEKVDALLKSLDGHIVLPVLDEFMPIFLTLGVPYNLTKLEFFEFLVKNLTKESLIKKEDLSEDCLNEYNPLVDGALSFNCFLNIYSILKKDFSTLEFITDSDIFKIISNTILNISINSLNIPQDILKKYEEINGEISLPIFLANLVTCKKIAHLDSDLEAAEMVVGKFKNPKSNLSLDMSEEAFFNLVDTLSTSFKLAGLDYESIIKDLIIYLNSNPIVEEDKLPSGYKEQYGKVKKEISYTSFLNLYSFFKQFLSNIKQITNLDIFKIIVSIIKDEPVDFLNIPYLYSQYEIVEAGLYFVEYLFVFSIMRIRFNSNDDEYIASITNDYLLDDMDDDYFDEMDGPRNLDDFDLERMYKEYNPFNQVDYSELWDDSYGNPKINPDHESFESTGLGAYDFEGISDKNYSFLEPLGLIRSDYNAADEIVIELNDLTGTSEVIDYFVKDYNDYPKDYENAEEVLYNIQFFYNKLGHL